MTIEVKIIACNGFDFAEQVAELQAILGDAVPPPSKPAKTLDEMGLQELIDLTRQRANAAGFAVHILPYVTGDNSAAIEDEKALNEDKIARRMKDEADSPAPVSSVEEDDEATDSPEDANLEDLKSDVIARCSQLMLDGKKDIVMALKKQFGRTLSNLEPERFPAIHAELERMLNDGQSDE